MAELKWEEVKSNKALFIRAKVPGGWLVSGQGSGQSGLTFVPDPKHEWK